jgi:hypothetical protein
MFLCHYKYIKGCRDGYVKDYLKKSRSFLYLPSKPPRLELNATLIILAIAIIRGLFTLDYVLTIDNKWLKTDNAVNDQAVFIAADRAGSLDANTPMRENALNLSSRQCASWLLSHNAVPGTAGVAVLSPTLSTSKVLMLRETS